MDRESKDLTEFTEAIDRPFPDKKFFEFKSIISFRFLHVRLGV